MTTAPLPSADLAARVTTLLARTFPEYVPGSAEEGFRVESPDTREPRRMLVRWHGGTPTRPTWTHGPALGREKYKAQLLEVLTRNGYAVTDLPGRMDVAVDDKPHNTSGPRFAPVPSGTPGVAPWQVVDLWTRAHVATAATEEEAAADAMEHERRHTVTEARMASHQKLWNFLEDADELLGDGLTWLRREVDDGRYGPVVRSERIDALVNVANALRREAEITQRGRLVAYPQPHGRGLVEWVAKSAEPAVGHFPGWPRTEAVNEAITLLVCAGLQPVRYGEATDDDGSFMCEAEGFMVSLPDPNDIGAPGVHLSEIGQAHPGQIERAADALRTAGWRVEADASWPGTYSALPPGK